MRGIASDGGYLLRVEKGASLLDAIADFAARKGIDSAAINGIGAVSEVELGYFHADKQSYEKTELEGEYELVQLAGNISIKDGAHFVHGHATLGASDLGCLSGHLFRAVVAVTAEVHLVPLGARVTRSMDAETGIALLDLPEI